MALEWWASAKLCGVEQTQAITLGVGSHSSCYCFAVVAINTKNDQFKTIRKGDVVAGSETTKSICSYS